MRAKLEKWTKKLYDSLVMNVSSQQAGMDALGNTYISDPRNKCIFKVSPEGEMKRWSGWREGDAAEKVCRIHPVFPVSKGDPIFCADDLDNEWVIVLHAREERLETQVIFMDISTRFGKAKVRRVFYYYDRHNSLKILSMDMPGISCSN
jgi:hypothetical protein